MARPKGDIDQRILHAARRRFLTEGVDGARLRAVARDAGTSIGMVYYYFRTKEDLFLGVVEEVYQRVLRDIELALVPDLTVTERVLRLYQRVNRLDTEELDVLRLVLRESLTSSARRERLLDRFSRGHFPIVVRTVLEGLADGTFERSLPPLVVLSAVVALGALPPAIIRVVGGRLPLAGPKSPDELPGELLQALLFGIGRRKPPDGPPRDPPAQSPPIDGRVPSRLKGSRKKKSSTSA